MNQNFMQIPAIAIHGGSGTIASNLKDPELKKQYLEAINSALEEGFKMLIENIPAAVAVAYTQKIFPSR